MCDNPLADMQTRSLAVAVLLAFVPVTFQAPIVFAQAPADASVAAARARFQEGVDFYDKGQYEAARASFLQASSSTSRVMRVRAPTSRADSTRHAVVIASVVAGSTGTGRVQRGGV